MRKWQSRALNHQPYTPRFTWPIESYGDRSTVRIQNFLHRARVGISHGWDSSERESLKFVEKLVMFMDMYIGYIPYKIVQRSKLEGHD